MVLQGCLRRSDRKGLPSSWQNGDACSLAWDLETHGNPISVHAVFSGYEALKGPREISGFEGDTISLRCTYEKTVERHRKYWCRQGGLMVSRCSDIVYTNQDQEVTRGRMSIRDSPRELEMTVTMRDLTLKDVGKYWCGVDRLGFDESFEVSLIVFPGNE